MARAYKMAWEGERQRWVKMYKGIRYRVSCEELRAMVYTAEGSYKLANEWWEKKVASLNPQVTAPEIVRRAIGSLDDLEQAASRGKAASDVLGYARSIGDHVEQLPNGQFVGLVDAVERGLDLLRSGGADVDELLSGFKLSESRKIEKAERLAERLSEPRGVVEVDRTIKVNAEKWLDVIRGEVAPKSFREIKEFTRWFYALPVIGADNDVATLDEGKVEEFFLLLKRCTLAACTKHKRWGFCRRLVRYFWSRKLIDLPRNLDEFSIKVHAKSVKRYTVDEVRSCLSSLKDRLKLYALLALNAGMTQVDIGGLRKDMIDLENGTLTRKRVKTAAIEGVPTVCYKLWPETIVLLKRFKSSHPVYFLTSKDNTPLYESRQEGDKTPHKDLILNQWRKYGKQPIPFKAFRSIGATLLESHPTYGRCSTLYLGQSPKSIKDRHYAAPPAELLNDAMDWLRGELLGK